MMDEERRVRGVGHMVVESVELDGAGRVRWWPLGSWPTRRNGRRPRNGPRDEAECAAQDTI
jgi:hypothetical protein